MAMSQRATTEYYHHLVAFQCSERVEANKQTVKLHRLLCIFVEMLQFIGNFRLYGHRFQSGLFIHFFERFQILTLMRVR